MKMGIGIGWPNASASNSAYSLIITNCQDDIIYLYSADSVFAEGIYLYVDEALTIPFDGEGKTYNIWNGFPINNGNLIFSDGQVSGIAGVCL